jgi:hypothetical protein
VLLVHGDGLEREAIGSWFVSCGFDVTACPGPAAPSYVCIGDCTGRCPLMDDADIVVLDHQLESDQVVEGTSVHDLLSLYVSNDKPVVVLGGLEFSHLFSDEQVVLLDEDPQGGVVQVARRLLGDGWS